MSFWAGVGGFFLVPVVGRVAIEAAQAVIPKASTADKQQTRDLAIAGAAYLGTAVVAFKMSKRKSFSKGEKSFARGGMWGAGIATLLAPAAQYMANQHPAQRPTQALSSGDLRGLAGVLAGSNGLRTDRYVG